MRYLFLVSSFLLILISNSCSEENKSESTKDASEKTEENDTVVEAPVHIPIDLKYTYDSLLNDLLKITFEPKLFENMEDAKVFLDSIELTYSVSFSPEETMSTIWITMQTSDKKNYLELNYHYYDEDGHFISFRNIISKIEDQNREKTIEALKKLAEKNTFLKGKKFKKDYGEEGWAYYEEGTGQTLQTIVSAKGGTTDWIEIRRTDYFFVTEKDLVE